MELSEPRCKRNYFRSTSISTFPLIFRKDNSIKKIRGNFNGFSVLIEDDEDMKNVVSMGYFGKGNFSRSYPQKNESGCEIIRERQYIKRKNCFSELQCKSMKKVIVVPDSDDENEEYFTNLKPQYQIVKSTTREKVWMSMEEAFFLANIINCLDIFFDNKVLNLPDVWTLFSDMNPHFIYSYVVYYHFRSKNWVVKPGIKFGGDYLLYKQGPQFYHASFVVIIDCLDQNLQKLEHLPRRATDNISLLALNRLCEAAGKELLICQVILPDGKLDYNNLNSILIKEILMRRWLIQDIC